MTLGERAQSAPLGVALLLGLTILGTTAVVVFGSAALTDTQEQSALARAEQTMTLFDSQAAQVALGDSSVQTVDFGHGDGSYQVDDTAGSVSIVQLDCDDDGDNGADYDFINDNLGEDDAYILSPRSLGAVTYESTSGDTMAYQGGGVWKRTKRGGAVMVSPPEFHYRGATLTLPLILTRGSGAGSGGVSASVTAPTGPTPVFPDSSDSFPSSSPDCGGEPYENPITDGTVIVRIESEYARAWGRYFETRTSGSISYFDADGDGEADDVAAIELVSLGQIGQFGMPGEGSSVTVSGASGGHSTEEFTITLAPDDSDAANFNNLQWSMYVDEGQYRLELHVTKGSGSGCSSGSTDFKTDANVYFSDDGGDTYQAWHKDDAFGATCVDADGDGSKDAIRLKMDFVDDGDSDTDYIDEESGDPVLEYVDDSALDGLEYYNVKGGDTLTDPVTFSGHGDWESQEYATSPSTGQDGGETIDRLINHYFAELPEEFELTVDDANVNSVSESSSDGSLTTGGSGRYVTYLHVTTNEIQVEVR
ncbi:hypothetical protein [Halosegnis sp.]|uniref:DUF7289 family protein n=1 Tax=Halosegnis sp. TaxID=2864959 RepID=UPI0035D43D27